MNTHVCFSIFIFIIESKLLGIIKLSWSLLGTPFTRKKRKILHLFTLDGCFIEVLTMKQINHGLVCNVLKFWIIFTLCGTGVWMSSELIYISISRSRTSKGHPLDSGIVWKIQRIFDLKWIFFQNFKIGSSFQFQKNQINNFLNLFICKTER